VDVILIRHAEAGERDASQWPDDAQRPITPDGRRKHLAVSRAMRKLGIVFDFLVTSPLVRARETAEVTAEAYDWDEDPLVDEALGPECSAAGVVRLLAKFPPDKTVALVGHEPSLSAVAAALIGRSGDARLRLKKSGVIGVTFDGAATVGHGSLAWLWKPGQLKRVK
jgi:phosphohistidine phosphatase